mgnify:CR=1 FL=1
MTSLRVLGAMLGVDVTVVFGVLVRFTLVIGGYLCRGVEGDLRLRIASVGTLSLSLSPYTYIISCLLRMSSIILFSFDRQGYL